MFIMLSTSFDYLTTSPRSTQWSGLGDGGIDGITEFKAQHRCNTICKKLRLQPLAMRVNGRRLSLWSHDATASDTGCGSLGEGAENGKDGDVNSDALTNNDREYTLSSNQQLVDYSSYSSAL